MVSKLLVCWGFYMKTFNKFLLSILLLFSMSASAGLPDEEQSVSTTNNIKIFHSFMEGVKAVLKQAKDNGMDSSAEYNMLYDQVNLTYYECEVCFDNDRISIFKIIVNVENIIKLMTKLNEKMS